jgi:hypothetical protein
MSWWYAAVNYSYSFRRDPDAQWVPISMRAHLNVKQPPSLIPQMGISSNGDTRPPVQVVGAIAQVRLLQLRSLPLLAYRPPRMGIILAPLYRVETRSG